MSDTPAPTALGGLSPEESAKLQEAFKDIATRSQKLLQDFSQKYQSEGPQPTDPLHLTQTFMDFTAKMMADPNRLVQAQVELWQQYMKLWQVTAQRMMGQTVAPVAEPARGDKRFNDPAWKDEVVFDYLKQSYLLTARWLQGTIKEVEGVDEKTAKKVDFYTRQFVDAMSPSNFAMTNPEVVKATVETKGENLLKGLKNLLADLERGKGNLAIRQTDMDAFKVGGNVATTPGKVVFQNDLMQLIQYAPATEKVYEVPLLIVPPWINKFYILDLKPENSFIKWATDQGYTVFVVSWVNPDERLAKMMFEDYMNEGPLAALDAIEKATGARKVTAIGYCIGGTLLAATLAYMAARGDDRIAACTFFTAQVDFSEPGELGVFIDEDQLASARGDDEQEGLSRRQRDGDDLQHAARQRSDLVLRRQQLPAGQGSLPLRPAVLERRRHAHAGGDAQLLPAQHVPEEPAQPAGRHRHRQRADRPAQDPDPRLYPGRQGRPHRAGTLGLQGDADLQRSGALRAGGLGSHRRRRQSAAQQEVPALAERDGEEPSELWPNGRPAPRNSRARGGTTGTSGCRRFRDRRWQPGCPAPAACRRSRTRRAAM